MYLWPVVKLCLTNDITQYYNLISDQFGFDDVNRDGVIAAL